MENSLLENITSIADILGGDNQEPNNQPAPNNPPANEPQKDTQVDDDKNKDKEKHGESGQNQENQGNDNDSVISALQQKFGFDFSDQQFEESIDGIYEMSRIAAEKIAEQQLNEFFEKFPDLAEYAEYRMNGGDPKAYMEMLSRNEDYAQMQFTEEDTATQRRILTNLLSRQGFDQESITATLNSWEQSKILYSQTKAALPILDKLTKAERQNIVENQKKAAQEMEQKRKQEMQEIQKTVATGSLKGIQIPEADKKQFLGWMFNVGKEGVTQRNAAYKQMSLEDKLALEYLVYKGFKLSEIVQTRVNTQKTTELKKLLKDKSGSRMKDDNTQRTEFNIPKVADLFN